MKKSLLYCYLGFGLLYSGSIYSDSSVSSSPSDDIDPISSVSLINGSFSFTIPESGVGGTMNGDNFTTLIIANNNADGYDIHVTGTKGSLIIDGFSSSDREGVKVDYNLSCGSYVLEDGSSVSSYSGNLSEGVITEMYSVSNPAEATFNQRPSCDLTLATGEDLDEKFGGTYSETLVFTITNH